MVGLQGGGEGAKLEVGEEREKGGEETAERGVAREGRQGLEERGI